MRVKKTRPGYYLHATIDLEVKKVGVLEGIVSDGATVAETAYSVLSGDIVVSA